MVSFLEGTLEHVVQRLAHLLLREAWTFGSLPISSRFPASRVRCEFQARPTAAGHTAVRAWRGQRREQMNGLNLLVFMPRGDFLRGLHGFLGLDRHFFKSQHNNLISSGYYRKSGTLASPFLLPHFLRITSLRQRPSPEFRNVTLHLLGPCFPALRGCSM